MLKFIDDSSPIASQTGPEKTISPQKSGASEGKHPRKKGDAWLDGTALEFCREHGRSMTARQIAETLGNGLTRMSVIGKCRRMGIAIQKGTNKPLSVGWGKRAAPAKPATAVVAATTPETPPLPAAAPSFEPPLRLRLSIMALTSRSCRWPIGDPRFDDFSYCGNRTEDAGRSYCAGHARLAYRGAGQ
jgi:GcrA cell cycle regulator